MKNYKCDISVFVTSSVGKLFTCEINISKEINVKGSPEKTKKEAERRASFELLCRCCPDQFEKIRLPAEACNKPTNQKAAPTISAGTY